MSQPAAPMPNRLIGLALLLLFTGTACRRDRLPPFSGVSMRPLDPPIITEGEKPLFPERVDIQLRQILYDSVSNGPVPGAVLYMSTPDGNWMGAMGKANLEDNITLRPTDRFRIGRLSELFVAVVCLQLVEEGELDLDGAIARWLPASVQASLPASKTITVRQLLNHTSGLPSANTPAFQQAIQANPQQNWTAQAVLSYAYPQKNAAPRGTFFYANTNYLLLQLIVERITGRSLGEAIQQRISEPLNLSNTFLELQQPIPGGFAQGYESVSRQSKPKNVTQPLLNTGLGLGSSGIVSNALDLVKVVRSLFTDRKLVRPESLRQMRKLVEAGQGNECGLGITHMTTPWGEGWGQTAKTTGFMAMLIYLPVHDLTVLAWVNAGNSKTGTPSDMIERSLEVVLGEPTQ